MPDLHNDLRIYFDHVVETIERGVGERPSRSPQRAHRARLVLAAAAAVVVAIVAASLVWASSDEDHSVVSTPSSRPTPSTAPSRLQGVWRELPTTNLSRSGYSSKSTHLFWTGDAVLTIDTESAGDGVLGEIYRPADGTVRRIADSGLEWRAHAAVVWTGTEAIVAGGGNGPGITHAAAAYNPTTDTWRALPDPPGSGPFTQKVGGPAVWTGTEMVAWRSGLAFNPTTNAWRPIAQPPIGERTDEAVVMTPRGVFVWGGCWPTATVRQCDEVIGGDELADGGIYNPATDSWTMLPPSPLGKGDHPTAAWTGTEVVVLLNIPDTNATVYAAAYNTATQTWRALPAPPFVGFSYAVTVWSGDYVITHTRRDGGTTALDPATNTWYTLPDGPTRDRQSALWAGDQLVVAGGHPSAKPWAFSFTPGQGTVAIPPTTAPPATTTLPPTGPTQLRALDSFRLGYEGFGPIKLGMTLTQASQAAGVEIAHIAPGGCANYHLRTAKVVGDDQFTLFGIKDGVIVQIITTNPAYYTISGIHVGNTLEDVRTKYPNAEAGTGSSGNPIIRITDPQGRQVRFSANPEGTVGVIVVSTNRSFESYTGQDC